MTRRARSTDDQARQVNTPAAPPRTRTINTPLTVRTDRAPTRPRTAHATDRRASSLEDGKPARPAKAGRACSAPQKNAPRRTATATTPPRPQPATSGPRAAHLARLDTQDRAREKRAAQERDQLAAERHARIIEARARLDAAAGTPRTAAPVPDDRDQHRQARDDGRTWTTDRGWTDQDRAGIRRFTKDPPTPREPKQDRAKPDARTDGHRREYNAREAQPRDRRSRTDRDRDAIADVGMYRAVSYKDLSEQHYDNHPYVTRRAVTRMVRAGLIEEHEATGPQGNTFKVLTATQRGRDAAHRAALDAGHVPEQQTWTGLVKPAELSHDTAVYRAALDERARIEAEGGRVVRVRLDAELKSLVATATETARAAGGDRAAETAKAAAAQELGLPMKDGHVMYPDAQLDIEDSDGMGGRVNVEIASDHYHAAAIVAKAGAGFAMHGSSQSASRNIGRALGRAAARETDSGPGCGSGPGREGSVEL